MPPRISRKRCWYLRLDWHDDRVRYIEAEDELVERFESSRETVTREAKAGRGDVRACVNEALVRLTRDAAIHGKARVFPKRTISKEAKLLWDLRGGAPDFAPSVRVTEKILDEAPLRRRPRSPPELSRQWPGGRLRNRVAPPEAPRRRPRPRPRPRHSQGGRVMPRADHDHDHPLGFGGGDDNRRNRMVP